VSVAEQRPRRGTVDPFVQEWVAATNGRLYIPLVNRLDRYPIPSWPLPALDRGLLLDIGCGWGRWMVAAGRHGYLPVGVDLTLEPLLSARRVLRDHGIDGHLVMADLGHLPFRTGVFDTIFSYSAIQHVDRAKARRCVQSVHRLLRPGGSCLLEFPNRHGLGRLLRLRRGTPPDDADPASGCVRYYSLRELREMFGGPFADVEIRVDCYLGIGVQLADLDILPWGGKAVVLLSEALKRLAGRVRPLRRLADSVYVFATRQPVAPDAVMPAPGRLARAAETPGLVDLLACPVSGGPLVLDERRGELVSEQAGLAFPIEDGVPNLLPSAGRRVG
jgi:uncharacterized protein YbaR (Trm112 family)/SAM-dependent methyltransferase